MSRGILAEPKQHVFLFRKRFHEPVISGAKLQTCRGVRKRPVRPGDLLSLRGWTGRAYGSPQFVLRESLCLSVEPIAIRTDRRRVSQFFEPRHLARIPGQLHDDLGGRHL
jgi:hypothetical protein